MFELMDATKQRSGSNLLGRWGYGEVYKGILRHTTVAVKFLIKVYSYNFYAVQFNLFQEGLIVCEYIAVI